MARIIEAISASLPGGAELATNVTVATLAGPERVDLALVRADYASTGMLAGAHIATAVQVRLGGSRRDGALSRAGVRCTWQVALDRQVGYRGPVPVIFVRTRGRSGWRESFYFRGRISDVPLCVGFDVARRPEMISVPLDPGMLAHTHWLGLMPGRPG
jgi:hypothetical protein